MLLFAKESAAETVQWVEPTATDATTVEAAKTTTKVVLAPTLDLHAFMLGGPVSGIATETGARIAVASSNRKIGSVGLLLSGIFPTGLFAFGFDAGKDEGIVMAGEGAALQLRLLLPHIYAKLATDFGDNVFFTPGASLVGFRATYCTPSVGFKFDVRLPTLTAWMPFKAAGEGLGSTRIDFVLSTGVQLEAGVFF